MLAQLANRRIRDMPSVALILLELGALHRIDFESEDGDYSLRQGACLGQTHIAKPGDSLAAAATSRESAWPPRGSVFGASPSAGNCSNDMNCGNEMLVLLQRESEQLTANGISLGQ